MSMLSSSRLICLLFAVSATPAFADPASTDTDQAHHHGHEMEEIFSTASPHAKSQMDVLQGSSLVTEEQLDKMMAATIGETLSGVPGVHSTFFGPGASRPVIRGLGGDRIRMLTNGIGTIDAANTSPDHAVAGDPLTARRVEVLKGASTLIYGNNAIGGVVNIIDDRIPTVVPDDGLDGRSRLSYGTVADDFSAGGALTFGLSEQLAGHVNGYYRDAGDYDIPGSAESEALHEAEGHDEHEEEEAAEGTVENSSLENKGGAFGLSWIGDDAMLGASVSYSKSNYGVPAGHVHEEEEEGDGEGDHEHEEEGPVRIDLEQVRFDLKGESDVDFAIFQQAKLRFGYGDYEHKELEGGETGTVFKNKGWEGRLELIQKEQGNWHGSMGIHLRSRDFQAIGDEAFVPPTDTFQWGVFAVEELELDPVTIDMGARFDHQKTDNNGLGISRAFDTVSLSAGAAYHLAEDSLIGINVSRAERAPTAEELFSNGPHIATGAFEVGDSSLTTEKGTTAEISFKHQDDRLSATLNLYHTWYNDFIYEVETGEEEDGLEVFQFRQQDATFWGFEAEASYVIWKQDDKSITFDAMADYVRAKLDDDLGDLPRIPPFRFGFGADYASDYIDARAEVRFVSEQDKISEHELPTEGYTEVNLEASWKPMGEEEDLALTLQVQNLTNEERRLHTSFLKDVLPLPGRNFRFSVNYGF
ncbi:TonB-dependent receptor [Emcibacter nanhaiensis]|uniref:TonB-dependent receptor n=1 Tax=Emcibacter nanhaiensis TaxID=1505037 RepID=A0A501PPF4_9PROT|nr:TonB-dependent receptor [Emcibacter nanhaiensis]TPD61651.1 TonB-dependent receptor [Emcibacter nanhaiensis]